MSSSRIISPATMSFLSKVFPFPFILIGALVMYIGGLDVYRANESLAWPIAEGRIRNSSVEYRLSQKGKSGTYHADILYSFTVNEKEYSGKNVAFGGYGSGESHAQNIVDRYPKDKIVSVRYLATDPDICVLEPGIHAQVLIFPGLGFVFFVIGILIAGFVFRPTHPKSDTVNIDISEKSGIDEA